MQNQLIVISKEHYNSIDQLSTMSISSDIQTNLIILKLLMNIKKTEEFLYFQNKARHYSNLRNAKSVIKTHRSPDNLSTLLQTSRMPYFKRYDLERENEGLINRISDILSNDKTEIQKHGYTRYNHKFTPHSHLSIEQKKNEAQINFNNQLLINKVLESKPSIGTIQNWNNHYKEVKSRKKIISKYTDNHAANGVMDIYTSTTFLPEHYRSFLNKSSPKRIHNPEEQQEQMPVSTKIRVQKLFQLPKLRRLRGSLTRLEEDKSLS